MNDIQNLATNQEYISFTNYFVCSYITMIAYPPFYLYLYSQ